MNRLNEIIPIYVEFMPEILEEGKLYISKRFELAIHLCACGCGIKSVTPIGIYAGKSEWVLTENNGLVSLTPSIGDWIGENPYHAHYFITNNKIVWS